MNQPGLDRLNVRTRIAVALSEWFEEQPQDFKLADASKELDAPVSYLSPLFSKLDSSKFSLDKLVDMANRAGYQFDFRVSSKATDGAERCSGFADITNWVKEKAKSRHRSVEKGSEEFIRQQILSYMWADDVSAIRILCAGKRWDLESVKRYFDRTKELAEVRGISIQRIFVNSDAYSLELIKENFARFPEDTWCIDRATASSIGVRDKYGLVLLQVDDGNQREWKRGVLHWGSGAESASYLIGDPKTSMLLNSFLDYVESKSSKFGHQS